MDSIFDYYNYKDSIMDNMYRYKSRQPTASERAFFLSNPRVGGYASYETNSIVHNPYNNFTPEQRKGIEINEGTRLFLNNHPLLQPTYSVTPYQKIMLRNYSPNIQDVRNTIAGRYYSGDTSIGTPSNEQINQLENIRKYVNILGGI